MRKSSRKRTPVQKFGVLNGTEILSDIEEDKENISDDNEEQSNAVVEEVKKPAFKRGKKTAGSAIDLYDILYNYRASLKVTANDLIGNLQKNPTTFVLAIVNLTLKVGGSKRELTLHELNDSDPIEILDEIQSKLSEQTMESSLQSKNKEFKKLKKSFPEFFSTLISNFEASFIINAEWLKSMLNWLITMTSSAFRPFRLAATTACLRILTGLCCIVASLSAEDKSKSKGSKKAKNNSEEKIVKLEELIQKIFNGVFVHRYRDVDPHIRAVCVDNLQDWIKKYSEVFLDNSYLRYIGWGLSDKSQLVRAATIAAVQELIKTVDLQKSAFLLRFKKRLIEMALRDVDDTIRAECSKLLCHLMSAGYLEDEEENCTLIINQPDIGPVRDALGDFIKNYVEQKYINDVKVEMELNGNKYDNQTIALKGIALFLKDVKLAKNISVFIGILYEKLSLSALTIFEILETGSLEDDEKTLLIQMLKEMNSQTFSDDQKEQFETLVMSNAVKLLTRDNMTCLKEFVDLLSSVDLKRFFLGNLIQQFTLIVSELKEIFLSTSIPELLNSICIFIRKASKVEQLLCEVEPHLDDLRVFCSRVISQPDICDAETDFIKVEMLLRHFNWKEFSMSAFYDFANSHTEHSLVIAKAMRNHLLWKLSFFLKNNILLLDEQVVEEIGNLSNLFQRHFLERNGEILCTAADISIALMKFGMSLNLSQEIILDTFKECIKDCATEDDKVPFLVSFGKFIICGIVSADANLHILLAGRDEIFKVVMNQVKISADSLISECFVALKMVFVESGFASCTSCAKNLLALIKTKSRSSVNGNIMFHKAGIEFIKSNRKKHDSFFKILNSFTSILNPSEATAISKLVEGIDKSDSFTLYCKSIQKIAKKKRQTQFIKRDSSPISHEDQLMEQPSTPMKDSFEVEKEEEEISPIKSPSPGEDEFPSSPVLQ